VLFRVLYVVCCVVFVCGVCCVVRCVGWWWWCVLASAVLDDLPVPTEKQQVVLISSTRGGNMFEVRTGSQIGVWRNVYSALCCWRVCPMCIGCVLCASNARECVRV
jgi:hypothetical protein